MNVRQMLRQLREEAEDLRVQAGFVLYCAAVRLRAHGRQLRPRVADTWPWPARHALSVGGSLLLIMLVAVMTLTAGLTAGTVAGIIQTVPTDEDYLLPTAPLASILYDGDGEQVTKFYLENRIPSAREDIPDTTVYAFIAVEDARFYHHRGVDLTAVVRAAVRNVRSGRIVQGGSTLTQQLARNAFDEIGSQRSLERKLREAWAAIQLERRYSKEEILTAYLNIIYLGEGAYGVGAAAQVYFDKEVSELDAAESALLAGITTAPSSYSPFLNPDAAQRRQQLVLFLMRDQGWLTDDEYEAARSIPVEELLVSPGSREPDRYDHSWFVDYAFQEVLRQLAAKYEEEEGLEPAAARARAESSLYLGGLQVHTTLNPELQRAAEQAVAQVLDPIDPPDGEDPVQVASLVIDPETGHVLALVGGRNHRGLGSHIRATGAKRQPGSALKPLIAYGPGLASGIGPAAILDDAPRVYGDGWAPRNVDHRFSGLLTAREALRRSVNVASIRMVESVGIDNSLAYAERLGIESLVPEDRSLAAVLGGLTHGVSPLELTRAYAAFANGGYRIDPIVIRRVVASDGTVILEHEPQRERVIRAEEAYLMTDMLRSAVRPQPGPWVRDGYTGARAVQGNVLSSWDAVGKTGTSDDAADIWFVGYTPKYVAAVWMGYDRGAGETRRPVEINGTTGFGGLWPSIIWNRVMTEAHADLEPETFQRPEGLTEKRICIFTGLLPDERCPRSYQRGELFITGDEPTESGESFVRKDVVRVDGRRLARDAAVRDRDPFIQSRPFVLADNSCRTGRTSRRWFLNRPPVDTSLVRTFNELVYEGSRDWRSLMPEDVEFGPPLMTCSELAAILRGDYRTAAHDSGPVVAEGTLGPAAGNHVSFHLIIEDRQVRPQRVLLRPGQQLTLTLYNQSSGSVRVRVSDFNLDFSLTPGGSGGRIQTHGRQGRTVLIELDGSSFQTTAYIETVD